MDPRQGGCRRLGGRGMRSGGVGCLLIQVFKNKTHEFILNPKNPFFNHKHGHFGLYRVLQFCVLEIVGQAIATS